MATITTSKRWDGNYSIYAQIDYSTSTSNTAVTVNVSLMRICPDVGWDNDQWAFKYYTSNNGGQTNISNSVSYGYQYYAGWTQVLGAQSRSFARKTSAYTVTLTVAFQTQWSGWYTGSVNITVPALASYAVKFYGNGATSGSTAAQTKYYGTNLTLNANGFVKTGYEFIGWNTNSSATSASYANKGTYTGNAAINLYAIWRKTITVTYDANGGSGAPGVSTGYAYNSATSTSITISNTVPTRTGYSTDGWADNASGSKAYNKNTAYTFSDSTTIYAHWNPISYSIGYDLTGGALPSGQTNPSTYNIETNTFTLKEPTKQYYEFTGWTGSNGNTPTKSLSISKGSVDNRNYIANWRSTWEGPGINIVTVRRASDSVDDDPSGERLYLEFTWTPGKDTTNSQSPVSKNPTSYVVTVEGSDGTTKTKSYSMSSSPVKRKYSATDIPLATAVSYTVTLTIKTTGYPDVILTDYISEAYFILDINSDGTAIGFGTAVDDGIGKEGFYCDMDSYLRKEVYLKVNTGATTGTDNKLWKAIASLGWDSGSDSVYK